MRIIERDLLTRKQIIEIWNEQTEEILNSLCCPECRGILSEGDDKLLYCTNSNCSMSDEIAFKQYK